MASCYYIYCTTLGLSWGFGNQGLGAFHPVPWYSFWYKLICTKGLGGIHIDSYQN